MGVPEFYKGQSGDVYWRCSDTVVAWRSLVQMGKFERKGSTGFKQTSIICIKRSQKSMCSFRVNYTLQIEEK